MGKIGFTSRVCIARVISLLCHKFNTVNKSGLRLQRQLRCGPWSKARGTNSSSVSAVSLNCCQPKALATASSAAFLTLRDFGSLQCMMCSLKPIQERWPQTPGSCWGRQGAKWERADTAQKLKVPSLCSRIVNEPAVKARAEVFLSKNASCTWCASPALH